VEAAASPASPAPPRHWFQLLKFGLSLLLFNLSFCLFCVVFVTKTIRSKENSENVSHSLKRTFEIYRHQILSLSLETTLKLQQI